MITNASIGVLSAPASPLPVLVVRELKARGLDNVVVISDGDEKDTKTLEIIRSRTDGRTACPGYVPLEAFHVPVYFVSNHNGPSMLELIDHLGIGVLLNAGTPRKLGPAVIDRPRFGIVNCHPGILPKYRGSSAVEWSLYNGDPVGVTAHFMSEEYDAGPIIFTRELDTSGIDYTEIRVRMTPFQAAGIAEATHQVLTEGKGPSDYAPQGDGQIWGVIPEEKAATLLNRTF